jgi:hypothetical protein
MPVTEPLLKNFLEGFFRPLERQYAGVMNVLAEIS